MVTPALWRRLPVWLVGWLVVGCASANSRPDPVEADAGGVVGARANTLTDAERADGWRLLFDGETTAGSRGADIEVDVCAFVAGFDLVDVVAVRAADTVVVRRRRR